MVKINSTIFRTITDEVTGANKSIGLFGKSFTELKNIFSSVKTNGLLKTYIISDKDRQCINDYNELINSGVKDQAKLEETTKGASAATAQMIKNANGNTIALDKMTIGAKAAAAGMKILSSALNIGATLLISWGFTKLIEGYQLVLNADEEFTKEFNDNRQKRIDKIQEELDVHEETIFKTEDEIKSLKDLQSQLDENKNSKSGLLSLEDTIQSVTGKSIDLMDSSATSYHNVTTEIQEQIKAKEELLALEKEEQDKKLRQSLYENVVTAENGKNLKLSELMGISYKTVRIGNTPGHSDEESIYLENSVLEEYNRLVKERLDNKAEKGEEVKITVDEGATILTSILAKFNNIDNRNSSTNGYDYNTTTYDANGKHYGDFLYDKDAISDYLNSQLSTLYELFAEEIADSLFSEKTIKEILEQSLLNGTLSVDGDNSVASINLFKEVLGGFQNKEFQKELDLLFQEFALANEEDKKIILGHIEVAFNDYFTKNGIIGYYNTLVPEYIETRVKEYYSHGKETTATIMDAVDAINSDIRPAISELGEAYKSIFTEDGFNLKAVNDEMIKGLEDAFGTDFRDELEEFSKVLYNPLSTENDVQTAFNDLVTDYVYASDVLDNLNDTTKDSIIRDFESLGITNAKIVATELLTAKKEALTIAQDNNINSIQKLNDISYDRIKTILDEADATEKTRKYLARLRYEEILISGKSKGEKTKEISELLVAYGLMSEELSKLYSLIHTYELEEKFGEVETIISDTFDAINNDFDNFLENFDEDAQEFIRMIKEEIVDKIPNEFKNLGNNIFGIAKSALASTGLGLDFETFFDVSDLEVNPNEIDDGSGKDSTKETEAKFDWIETKIEHLSSKAEKEAKKATDSIFAYISKKYKKSHLNSAISFSQKAINATREGKAYYEKERDKIGLSKVWADKVKYGAIDIDSDELKGKDELIKKIEEYQELTDKINNCTTTIEDLVSNIQEHAEQLANLPIEEAEKKIDKYNAKVDVLSAKYENLNSYTAMNKNLDKQYDYAQAETKTREQAKKETDAYLKETWGSKELQSALKSTSNKYKKIGDELSTYGLEVGSTAYNAVLKYNEALKVSIETQNKHALAIENETKLLHENTKAKYDNIAAHYEGFRSMTESKISQVDAYLTYRDARGWSNVNDGEKDALKEKLNLQNRKTYNLEQERKKYSRAKIEEQYKNKDIGFEEYTELISYVDELDASILQSKTDALETQKVLNEFKLTSLGYQITEAQSKIDKFANDLALKEKKFGEKSLSKDNYSRQISDNNTLVGLYQKQNKELTILRDNTTKYSDLWFEYQEQIDANNSSINDLKLSNEDLKDSIRQIDTRPYVEMREETEKTISTIDSLIGLIDDNSLFDDEGALTKLGSAKFSILSKELDEAKESVSSYQKQIEEVEKQYKNYLNGVDNGYSQTEYEEDMKELTSGLLDAITKSKSVTDAIISMHTQQQQVIIDALKEEIAARNEALQKKKEYYDYDKQIRTKTKDIQALEAQKAALEVTEDSLEKRRKLVELEAELTKQREELEETQKDHEINLVVNGLNEFTEDVQERFDDYTKELANSFEMQIEVIKNATEMYSNGFKTIGETFNAILSYYGIDTSTFDVGKLDIPGFATGGVIGGTSYNGDKLIARVNSGESILTQDFTDLLPHAVNVMQDLVKVNTPNLSHLVKVQPAINVSYDNLINIEGNATNETIVELKKLMPSITKQVTKSIKDDMKKSGY